MTPNPTLETLIWKQMTIERNHLQGKFLVKNLQNLEIFFLASSKYFFGESGKLYFSLIWIKIIVRFFERFYLISILTI